MDGQLCDAARKAEWHACTMGGEGVTLRRSPSCHTDNEVLPPQNTPAHSRHTKPESRGPLQAAPAQQTRRPSCGRACCTITAIAARLLSRSPMSRASCSTLSSSPDATCIAWKALECAIRLCGSVPSPCCACVRTVPPCIVHGDAWSRACAATSAPPPHPRTWHRRYGLFVSPETKSSDGAEARGERCCC
jgi:hypothetical protein